MIYFQMFLMFIIFVADATMFYKDIKDGTYTWDFYLVSIVLVIGILVVPTIITELINKS